MTFCIIVDIFQVIVFICLYFTLVLSTITMNANTMLIMFAVIAAFGVVMATVAVLPIIPQANALVRATGGPPCFTNEHVAAHAKPCLR
jgi:hypothetical protein